MYLLYVQQIVIEVVIVRNKKRAGKNKVDTNDYSRFVQRVQVLLS